MTVSSSTNRVSYAGNGSTTVFPYTYKIFDQDDLTVILRAANGTETVQTITSQYTVSGVGNAGGGNVTMLTAPASGTTLVILREQDLVQELDIVPNDPFPADSLEGALDKLTFMVQQHEETLGRSLKVSRTTTITSPEFTEDPATRANKFLSFDASGDLFVADTTDGGVAVSTYMETFLQSSDSPTAFTYLGVTSSAAELNTLDGITASTAELNTLDGITATTAQLNNSQFLPSSGPLSNRNKIINGSMTIDQRNAGAAVTPTNTQYLVDRWWTWLSQASKITAQQNAGGVTPPAGFPTYQGITSSSAYSVLTSDYFALVQHVEAVNFTDLAWGTADAKPVTLSFWVRSSLTGTFGGAFANAAQNRSYPFAYTINSANTWEYITITVAGDTSGTWEGATNGIGVRVQFGLGVGSSNSNTAGAWYGANYISATGATSVVGTSGATFYLTGVQLEAGDTATPFEHRSYGAELALCQRYCEIISTPGGNQTLFLGQATSGSAFSGVHKYVVEKRASPTLTINNLANTVLLSAAGAGTTAPTTTLLVTSTQIARIAFSGGSGLVAGNASQLLDNGSSAPLIIFSAEL
jgi:hypothetical protein